MGVGLAAAWSPLRVGALLVRCPHHFLGPGMSWPSRACTTRDPRPGSLALGVSVPVGPLGPHVPRSGPSVLAAPLRGQLQVPLAHSLLCTRAV